MCDLTIHPLRASVLTDTPPRVHPSISGFLKIFKTRLVGKSIHTLYKKCFVLLSHRCGITQSTPRGPASLLAHRLESTAFETQSSRWHIHSVSSSKTICNSPNPPLADIILFGLSVSSLPSKFLGRGFHTLIKKEWFVLLHN